MLKLFQVNNLSDQHVDNSTYNFTTGYGQLAKAGASVTIGAKVKVHVDIETTTITQQNVLETCQKVAKQYHKD